MEQFTLIKNKKAQGWGIDLMAAIIIFISAVIILYIYAVNYASQSQDKLEEITYEGRLLSELILSEDDFGILTNSNVNETKLSDFNNSYDLRKAFFGVKYNFYFTIDNLDITEYPGGYVGKINTSEVENLIQVTRLTIYNYTITKFEVYVWEE